MPDSAMPESAFARVPNRPRRLSFRRATASAPRWCAPRGGSSMPPARGSTGTRLRAGAASFAKGIAIGVSRETLDWRRATAWS